MLKMFPTRLVHSRIIYLINKHETIQTLYPGQSYKSQACRKFLLFQTECYPTKCKTLRFVNGDCLCKSKWDLSTRSGNLAVYFKSCLQRSDWHNWYYGIFRLGILGNVQCTTWFFLDKVCRRQVRRQAVQIGKLLSAIRHPRQSR